MRVLRWLWALLWWMATSVWVMGVCFLGFFFAQRSNPVIQVIGTSMATFFLCVLVPRLAIGLILKDDPPEPWRPDGVGGEQKRVSRAQFGSASSPSRHLTALFVALISLSLTVSFVADGRLMAAVVPGIFLLASLVVFARPALISEAAGPDATRTRDRAAKRGPRRAARHRRR